MTHKLKRINAEIATLTQEISSDLRGAKKELNGVEKDLSNVKNFDLMYTTVEDFKKDFFSGKTIIL